MKQFIFDDLIERVVRSTPESKEYISSFRNFLALKNEATRRFLDLSNEFTDISVDPTADVVDVLTYPVTLINDSEYVIKKVSNINKTTSHIFHGDRFLLEKESRYFAIGAVLYSSISLKLFGDEDSRISFTIGEDCLMYDPILVSDESSMSYHMAKDSSTNSVHPLEEYFNGFEFPFSFQMAFKYVDDSNITKEVIDLLGSLDFGEDAPTLPREISLLGEAAVVSCNHTLGIIGDEWDNKACLDKGSDIISMKEGAMRQSLASYLDDNRDEFFDWNPVSIIDDCFSSLNTLIEGYQLNIIIDSTLEILENSIEGSRITYGELTSVVGNKLGLLTEESNDIIMNTESILCDADLSLSEKLAAITSSMFSFLDGVPEEDEDISLYVYPPSSEYSGASPVSSWLGSIEVDFSKPLTAIGSALIVGSQAIVKGAKALGKMIFRGFKKVSSFVHETFVDPHDLIVNDGRNKDLLVDVPYTVKFPRPVGSNFSISSRYRDIITPFGRLSFFSDPDDPDYLFLQIWLTPTAPTDYYIEGSDDYGNSNFIPFLFYGTSDEAVEGSDPFDPVRIAGTEFGQLTRGISNASLFPFIGSLFSGESWNDYEPDYNREDDDYWLSALATSRVRLEWFAALLMFRDLWYDYILKEQNINDDFDFSVEDFVDEVHALLDFESMETDPVLGYWTIDETNPNDDHLRSLAKTFLNVIPRITYEVLPDSVTYYPYALFSTGEPFIDRPYYNDVSMIDTISIFGGIRGIDGSFIGVGDVVTNQHFFALCGGYDPAVTSWFPENFTSLTNDDYSRRNWFEDSFLRNYSTDGFVRLMKAGFPIIFIPYLERSRAFDHKFEIATDSKNGEKVGKVVTIFLTTVAVVVIGIALIKFRRSRAIKRLSRTSELNRLERDFSNLTDSKEIKGAYKRIKKLRRKLGRGALVAGLVSPGVLNKVQSFKDDDIDIEKLNQIVERIG